MVLDVAEDGVLIPRDLLRGVEKVNLRVEGDRIVVIPVVLRGADQPKGPEPAMPSIYDPIHGLGSNPVRAGITDGSVRHDHYIYGDPHGEDSP